MLIRLLVLCALGYAPAVFAQGMAALGGSASAIQRIPRPNDALLLTPAMPRPTMPTPALSTTGSSGLTGSLSFAPSSSAASMVGGMSALPMLSGGNAIATAPSSALSGSLSSIGGMGSGALSAPSMAGAAMGSYMTSSTPTTAGMSGSTLGYIPATAGAAMGSLPF